MRRRLLERLRCPYCLGRFASRVELASDAERVRLGLVECRCFAFPIVDGVLLLGLTKGYGGAEEALQPYVPLQVAAIHFVGRADERGLKEWISRHAPLVARVMDPARLCYVDWLQAINRRLTREIERELGDCGRFEVLGRPAVAHRRPVLHRLVATPAGGRLLGLLRSLRPPLYSTFYAARFLGREQVATRALLATLPAPRRALSLCCGHGPFELLASTRWPEAHIVSIDGQLLNLLTTRRFVHPEGDFICHDLQLPLPFDDGSFDGVFSAHCLGEIPAQATFAREAARVSASPGWTVFDGVTPDADRRVAPLRHYRFCQNHFATNHDHLALFEAVRGGRALDWYHTTPGDKVRWRAGDPPAGDTIGFCLSAGVSLADGPGLPPFTAGERGRLCLDPRYRFEEGAGHLRGRLDATSRWERWLHPDLAGRLPDELYLAADELVRPERLAELYLAGVLMLLPDRFHREQRPVLAERGCG